MEHLVELRGRLLRSLAVLALLFFACLYFASNIFAFLVQPLLAAGQGKIIYTDVFEAFLPRKGGFVRRADARFPFSRASLAVRRARALLRREGAAAFLALAPPPAVFSQAARLRLVGFAMPWTLTLLHATKASRRRRAGRCGRSN